MRPPALLALLALLLAPSPARAHRGSAKYLAVERTPEGARLDVEIEVVDAAVELGLGEAAPEREVLLRADDVRTWLASGIRVGGAGGACEPEPGAVRAVEGEDGPQRLSMAVVYRCPGPVRDLVLDDRTIFPGDPQHEAFVRIRFAADEDPHVLRAGRQTLPLGEPPSVPALLGRFVVEGALHLAWGYDHLLFLVSLVLTAGGLAHRRGLGPALRDVAVVVTAFTIGHSVTLIAAALGALSPPARVVESVIAGSIAIVALSNVARPEARTGMPWLAGGFGLVHGLGFSGVLAELGLPARARVLSLLAFNVGIELAQLAFVAALLGPLAWLAGRPGYRRWIVQGGSIAIALLALAWMVERATGPS